LEKPGVMQLLSVADLNNHGGAGFYAISCSCLPCHVITDNILVCQCCKLHEQLQLSFLYSFTFLVIPCLIVYS
jgi:hypothetical protein